MTLGVLSHRRGFVQVQHCWHTSLSGIMISWSESGAFLAWGPLDASTATMQLIARYTVSCMGATLTTVKEGCC